jgi:hypothetical protein
MSQIEIANANLLVDEVRWRVYCYHEDKRVVSSRWAGKEGTVSHKVWWMPLNVWLRLR